MSRIEAKRGAATYLLVVGALVVLVAALGLVFYYKNNGPSTTTTTMTAPTETTIEATPTTIPSTTLPATTLPSIPTTIPATPTTVPTTIPGTPTTIPATTTTYSIPSGSTVHTIEIINLKFVPTEVTIKKGDTVKWVNNDILGDNPRTHLINQYEGEFRSERLYYKDTFVHTFNNPGEYVYMDTIFPKIMRAKIIVLDEKGNIPTGSFIANINPMGGNPMVFLLISVIVAGMVTGYVLGFKRSSY